ncbi:AAC(3)-I family aminoglycoside N-acetyltransferase [Bowmanella dokdonensis]|uniref:AAC(3)-I family aminoglycoside N-acetyltransferase n=1 Tax=Bowmanella dokdonensis TaxID=751969 RepID=A0A939INC1_9ALTE|nr:AAC(3)-I family aminoglycoside N-acetyltransferase [Bowmanella dokdonensis]MBN7824670.1 AAC(3)-I family aminoglycoside N-acetyltransferase [Bowmanella dokdonensis]
MAFSLRRLGAQDLVLMDGLLQMFGEVFDDLPTYTGNKPDVAYLKRLLADQTFIALVAHREGQVIGGLAAYVLRKFEQPRSEIYIYDLAVYKAHRRQGVATALIDHLREIARQIDAWAVFVQADTNEEDRPAIALYSKLGSKEEVLHFDLM